MLWMTIVSFRRNFRKYSLAMLGLTLAVLVSCLGISGLSILQQSALQPLKFIGGENVIIADDRTTLETSSKMVYADPLMIKPFSADLVTTLLHEAAPNAKTKYTLIAPYRYKTSIWAYAGGRENPQQMLSDYLFPNEDSTEIVISAPGVWMSGNERNREAGKQASWSGQNVSGIVPLEIPRIVQLENRYEWSIPDARIRQYQVQGIYNAAKTLYYVDWVELSDLQSQVGGEKPVSWIGIECPVDQMETVKQNLVAKITELELPLQVWTVYDLGRLLIGDFERFEKMAGYYVPVMMFVAILIVLVNAIALTLARRKELALLRIVGFSMIQIQVMFIVECVTIALLGGLLGTGISAVVSLRLSKDIMISWYPFFIAVGATAFVSTVTTVILTKGSLANTLRNPTE